jgi:asparagine synthase (glutamine-hydrolysing)
MRYADIAARRIGTRHESQELVLGDIGEAIDGILGSFDEPVSDATSLAVFHLSRLARARAKVVLSGDGGDEIFGGYGWHESSLAYDIRRKRIAGLLPFLGWADRRVLSMVRGSVWAARAEGVRKLVSSDAVDRYFALRGFFTLDERRAIFPSLPVEEPSWLFRRFYRQDLPPAARLCHIDLKTYLPDNNLALVDRASMAHGLEVRVPLLDRRLVEFALGLADDQLVRPGATKILFRRAIEPWLPREILDRPKYGFSPPFKQWVAAANGRPALDRLRRGALAKDGIVDVRALERRIASGMSKRWNKLWLLVVLDRWYSRWISGVRERSAAALA